MKKCPACSSENIVGVEIMGTYDGVVLWQCNDCGTQIHRVGGSKVVKHYRVGPSEYDPVTFELENGSIYQGVYLCNKPKND